MPQDALSRAATLVTRRIHELQGRKTQAQIAREAGFESANMLSMIKSGTAKLPLEWAPPLARALETDETKLLRLALEQYVPQDLLRGLFDVDTQLVAVRTALLAQLAQTTHKLNALQNEITGIQEQVLRIQEDVELVVIELGKLGLGG